MIWQHTPYTLPLIVASAASGVLAIYIWWRFRRSWAIVGAVLILASAEWTFGYALELGSATLSGKIFWNRMQFLGIAVIPLTWLVYMLHYTGHEKWVTRGNLALLAVLPVITLLLVFTNQHHRLIWSTYVLITEGPYSVLQLTHGPWFWLFVAHSYTLILFGVFLLVQIIIRGHRLYRRQTFALLVGSFVPWLGNILQVFRLSPFPYLELTPLGFPVTNVAVALSLLYLRLGDIVPVAREMVIEGMNDGIIVLDSQHRILDMNPSARHIIGEVTYPVIGQPIQKVWLQWTNQIEPNVELEKEIILDIEEGQRMYDVRISPLTDWRGGLVSQVVVLRDITERKHAEDLLQESEEKFRTIFEHANDEIVYLDRNGIIVETNKKLSILGYKKEEIKGRNFTEFGVLGLDIQKMDSFFREVINQGNFEPLNLIELELNHKNGNKVYVEVSMRIIKKGEEVEGVLAIVRDITERKGAEEQIKQSLREKEVLLREIHHRVKNNLQIISSLLNLQSAYIKDIQYEEMLKESQNRIKSMALIHEELYQSEDLANIDFKEYIQTLVHGLVRSYRVSAYDIALTIDVRDVSLGVDTAIPCGLIINELVSNSLKHAFPDGKGQITVKARRVDGMTELLVSDNGIGIPDTIDFRNTETLGLRLVTILVEDQLKGNITLDTRKGTTFLIRIGEFNLQPK